MTKTAKIILGSVIAIVVTVVCITLAAVIVSLGTRQPEQIACTADAKLCPDGSYVGRTGPNCEFALCP